MTEEPISRKPNRGYDETHATLLSAALKLLSDGGEDALSIAALARAAGINRTTVYYHFSTRDALLQAVRHWSSGQLSKAFSARASQSERIDSISRFVLENPYLIRLWIEDFVSGTDIRASYPDWDALVEGTSARLEPMGIDAEVFATLLVTGAVIGPRVFRNAVRPDLEDDEIVARFRREQERVLTGLGLFRPDSVVQ